MIISNQQEPYQKNTTTSNGISSAIKTNPSSSGLVPRSFPTHQISLNNNKNEWDLDLEAGTKNKNTSTIASTIIHSSSSSSTTTTTTPTTTTTTPTTMDHNTTTSMDTTITNNEDSPTFNAIMQEPHACLVLALFFLWMIVQSSFDEIFSLWYLCRHLITPPPTTTTTKFSISNEKLLEILPSMMKHIAGTLAIVSGTFCLCQMFVCCTIFSSNVMTPRATLRLGLIFQIPIIVGFSMIDFLHLEKFSFGSLILMGFLFLKQIIGAIALHGLLTLLDNSIAVDRRLVVHHACHVVKYGAIFLGTATTPALFSLLLYFKKSFPFDQNGVFLIQAAGLIGLLFVSLIIPSRLNFPQLFTIGKR
jgi:hypothetical protein